MADTVLPNTPHRRGGSRGRAAAQAPTRENVPAVAAPQDIGLNVPPGAFTIDVSDAVTQAGAAIADAANRVATNDETVARSKAFTAFDEQANAELRRIETEEDMTDPKVMQAFGKKIAELKSELVTNHPGRGESRAYLDAKLEGMRGTIVDEAAEKSALAKRKMIRGVMKDGLQRVTAGLADRMHEPGALDDAFKQWDLYIEENAGALDVGEEDDYRDGGRQEIIISSIEQMLNVGDAKGALAALNETPGVRAMLTPDQQRKFDARFAEIGRRQEQARVEAQAKIDAATTILGRPPSAAERMRLAGLEPDAADKTASDKIAEMETALGRKLTKDEKERALGLGINALTDPGKLVMDRQRFVEQYGEDSPQVKAFDAAAKTGDGADLTDIGQVRKEFTSLSRTFVDVRDAYGKISAAAAQDSGAGDIALIYSFVRMQSPGIVSDREADLIASTGGAGERVQAMWARWNRGERLTDGMRDDLSNAAKAVMRSQLKGQKLLEDQYRNIAIQSGIRPQDVLVDFMGDEYRQLIGEPGRAGTSGNPIQVDAQGRVIGGQQSTAPQPQQQGQPQSQGQPQPAAPTNPTGLPSQQMRQEQDGSVYIDVPPPTDEDFSGMAEDELAARIPTMSAMQIRQAFPDLAAISDEARAAIDARLTELGF